MCAELHFGRSNSGASQRRAAAEAGCRLAHIGILFVLEESVSVSHLPPSVTIKDARATQTNLQREVRQKMTFVMFATVAVPCSANVNI